MAEHKQYPPIAILINDEEINQRHVTEEDVVDENLDHTKLSKWLTPGILAANDGLVTTASIMLGMGAVSQNINAIILTGFLALIAGACSVAISEFISIDSTLDIEAAGNKRDPLKAAIMAASAFSVGAMVVLLGVALLLVDYKVSLGVVEGPISVVLAVFGWIGPFLDDAPGFRAALRVLLWGWVIMVVTFGLLLNSDW